MLQLGNEIDFSKKMNLVDVEEDACDEAKGDSRSSPMYARMKTETNVQQKPKKGVSFHTTAFVVLIPTVQEYHDAGLGDLLWWNECDFQAFKVSAAKDVREFMKSVPHLDAKSAMKTYFRNITSEFEDEPASPSSCPVVEGTFPVAVPRSPSCVDSSSTCLTQNTDEQHEEEEKISLSDLPPIATQRKDSITNTKFERHHFTSPHSHFVADDMKSMEFPFFPNEQGENTKAHYYPPPSISYENESDTFGVSMNSISVLGRVIAVGFLLLMNRSSH